RPRARHDGTPRLGEARTGRRSPPPAPAGDRDGSGIHPSQAHAAGCDRGGKHEIVPILHRAGEDAVNAMSAREPHAAAHGIEPAEWDARVKLAACYRMVAKLGMDDLIYNHISLRVPGQDDQFLINPYGLLFDEI